MRRRLFCFATALACTLGAVAHAHSTENRAPLENRLLDVEIYDRDSGQALPIYMHRGQRYVAGEPGREYEIRIRNQSGGRILAITSVDGVNVVSGKTAAPDQSGYVINAYDSVSIDGWRKSLGEVATFYFTSLRDSYAARTGRPDNVGVIGVALFREAPPPVAVAEEAAAAGANRASAPAPASAGAASDSSEKLRREQRLGTGHGERHASLAERIEFERATHRPESIIRIFYDSRRNLLARGVIRAPRVAERLPEAFPAGFVPDP
jgi:hypothetical protein